jgi:hypothetical protein
MSASELLLRTSIWPAVAFGLAACLGWRETLAWRAGAALYAVHVVSAFQHAYRWSHERALADNIRQVRDTLGFEFGAGIWVNYAFTLGWMIVAILWPRLPRTARIVWRAFFLFIAFNGAVVFAHEYGRWIGATLFLVAGLVWFRGFRTRSKIPDLEQ